MKGYIIIARNSVERHLMEDVLRSRRIRYEIWRTRDDLESRYFHYWTTPLSSFLVKIDLLREAFHLFKEERRKQRVAAL